MRYWFQGPNLWTRLVAMEAPCLALELSRRTLVATGAISALRFSSERFLRRFQLVGTGVPIKTLLRWGKNTARKTEVLPCEADQR